MARLEVEPVNRGADAGYEVIQACRACASARLREVLSFGELPLTDAYLDAGQNHLERKYPLDVVFCEDCSLLQTRQTISPTVLFTDYVYHSSFAESLLEHARSNALELIESRRLDATSLVVELASNDGYMLRNFAAAGIPVLGIDPARGPAAVAESQGIPTLREFFGIDVAERLRLEGKRADLIIANNVLAHVPDLNGFVQGMAVLLKDEGVAVIEVPYVRDLIDRLEFDTIYHEHLCYFSVSALVQVFAKHGLSLNKVQHHAVHGGTLRLYLGPVARSDRSVEHHLREELETGVVDYDYYRTFAAKVRDTQAALRAMLTTLKKKEGVRIAAYGAAAKGTVLLNSAQVGPELIDFVVDRNPHKQGRLLPGVHIPISAPSRLLEEMPDYTLLLAWNFRDEVLDQQREYRARGGRFVVPIPHPEVI